MPHTFYVAVTLDDEDPRIPEDGEAFYVNNGNYESDYIEGLTGYVQADVERKLEGYEQAVLAYASLFPEKFPPGHPLHDADHRYWDAYDPDNPDPELTHPDREPYQWDSDTAEWIAMDLESVVSGDPRL